MEPGSFHTARFRPCDKPAQPAFRKGQEKVIEMGANTHHILKLRSQKMSDAMTKSIKVLSAAIMGLTIAGCSLVLVEDMPGPRANYFDGDFEFATHKGAIVTMVAGNPFGLPKDQFDDAVRRDLAKSVSIGTAKFVAAAGEQTVAPFKVVVAFNTASSIDNHDLCKQGANIPITPQTGEVNVKMAFCDGDNLKSGSTAWVGGASTAQDARFKDLVKQAAVAMLPAQDSEDVGEPQIP